MKNWEKCEADVVKLLNKHYTKGRSGRRIQYIVEHYNAGNLTVEGCWSVWQTRQASAHYQVEDDGRIGQLVWDSNTAWHAGNWDANCKSIGIEHANMADGTITEATLDNGAHLTAALCHLYGLGRPQWGRNVYPHKHFQATSCPGQIYGSQRQAYIERAQYWYDKMAGKNPEKPSSSGSTSKPSTGSGGKEHTGTGFGGTYVCNCSALNVRTSPTTSASVVAQYKRGQTVTLDDWYKIADGYVWGRYTGASSGKKRYVAVGRATGKPESNDYLVRRSTSQASGGDFHGGKYRCNVAVLNVRSAPSTSASVVAQYKRGQTVVLDDWYKISGGYVWARYTGATSGKKRYVAVGRATGKPESNDYLVRA